MSRIGNAPITVPEGVEINISDENLKEMTSFIKEKEFGNLRKWVANNLDNDPSRIYRKIYDILYTNVTPNTVPNLVLIIADYPYKSAFVADHEINMLACLTEIMSQVEFK